MMGGEGGGGNVLGKLNAPTNLGQDIRFLLRALRVNGGMNVQTEK